MSFREADPATYDAEYFRDIERILEVGVGSSGLGAVTPLFDPEQYVLTDVLRSYFTPLAANLSEHRLMLWERQTPDSRIIRLNADGTHLPFRDESFDAVFAANVIGDPSIPGYDKQEIISEAIRVTSRRKGAMGASALWLLDYNTPEYANEFMASWLSSGQNRRFSVERATIQPTDGELPEQYRFRNYPLVAGYGHECTIYKIAAADHDTPTS